MNEPNWKILKKLRTETETVPALLSVRQVASLFPTAYDGQVKDATIRQWISLGIMEGTKVGKNIWVTASEVNRFIEEKRQPKKGGYKKRKENDETSTD